MRIRVKMCGMMLPEDALKAAELGVDAIGLICYPKSPRYISIAQAQAILQKLPAFVDAVAVFANPAQAEVEAVLTQLPVQILQFHGDESPDFCNRFKMPYLKAIRMQEKIDLVKISHEYVTAKALLLDTFAPHALGGTGVAFDWKQIPALQTIKKPVILAGGLNPENINAAISQVRPYAIDVSSGIEISPGVKDHAKMAKLMERIYNANRTLSTT